MLGIEYIKMSDQYDVLIIGAGVVGNSIARELSRYRLNIGVLEKEQDVGMGSSSRNSGVLHSGIHYKPGTLRARLDVQGNSLMKDLHCGDSTNIAFAASFGKGVGFAVGMVFLAFIFWPILAFGDAKIQVQPLQQHEGARKGSRGLTRGPLSHEIRGQSLTAQEALAPFRLLSSPQEFP